MKTSTLLLLALGGAVIWYLTRRSSTGAPGLPTMTLTAAPGPGKGAPMTVAQLTAGASKPKQLSAAGKVSATFDKVTAINAAGCAQAGRAMGGGSAGSYLDLGCKGFTSLYNPNTYLSAGKTTVKAAASVGKAAGSVAKKLKFW